MKQEACTCMRSVDLVWVVEVRLRTSFCVMQWSKLLVNEILLSSTTQPEKVRRQTKSHHVIIVPSQNYIGAERWLWEYPVEGFPVNVNKHLPIKKDKM